MTYKTKVFVYGTLKKGNGNHGFLKEATYIGDAWTKEEYTLLTDHYVGLPYVIKEPSYSIAGEIYEVDEHTFMTLDNLEGHPHFYERELIDCFIPISANIRGQDIVEEKAWLYFLKDYDTTAIRKLPTGVW
tara:strand:+ start:139 stop:531 length:393 start_codon:yes stop_codon:yes gene_type:complete